MSPTEALASIQGYAAAGRFFIGGHAWKRMRGIGRNPGRAPIERRDIQSALVNARRCSAQDADRWRVEGPDVDGDPLELVVVIEDGVIVVTVL